MPRLFTAISIPDDVADGLVRLMSGLRGARWIERGNLHLTLRFIGDVDGQTADAVVSALDRQQAAGFDLALSGLNVFGGRKPHSVFADVQPAPALFAFQAAQERLIQGVGLPAERRKYTPHVTLARLRRALPGDVAAWLTTFGDFRCDPWHVTDFHLMSSRDSTGGGPYVPVISYPLADTRETEMTHGR